MMRQDSIHRRQALENSGKISFLGRELSSKSLYEVEEADVVVPCVTQDEEDEAAQPSALPQALDQSLQSDIATDIWTDDASLGKDSRSEIDANNAELESRRIRSGHEDDEHYGVETYLEHYETMLQRQEDENIATLVHLMPMLEVLEALVKGQTSARIPNKDTVYYDHTTMLKEFKLPELKRAYKQLDNENTNFKFIRTDQQFMVVLKLLTQTSIASRSVSWAEIAHCYKICISGMQVLHEIPAGKMRNQIKERTISSLQGLTAPKVPSSILKPNSKPAAITSVTTSSSSATISPLANSETKGNFQAVSIADPLVVKMKEAHESDVKEINLLKLTIAFLLGLIVSVSTIAYSKVSAPSSIDIVLEQMLEAKAAAAEVSASEAITSASIPSIASQPQEPQIKPQEFHLQPQEVDMLPPDMEEEEEAHEDTIVPIGDLGVLESDKKKSELRHFNVPTPIQALDFTSLSSLSAEARKWGGIVVATAVAPAVLQAAIALASTSFLLPLSVAMVAAASTLDGVREAVLHWLRRFKPLRKS